MCWEDTPVPFSDKVPQVGPDCDGLNGDCFPPLDGDTTDEKSGCGKEEDDEVEVAIDKFFTGEDSVTLKFPPLGGLMRMFLMTGMLLLLLMLSDAGGFTRMLLTGVLDSMGTNVWPIPEAIMARANLAYTFSAGVVCILGDVPCLGGVVCGVLCT